MEFEFKALDSSGSVVTETAEASDHLDLLHQLKEKGYTVLHVSELKGEEQGSGSNNWFSSIRSGWVGVSSKDLMLFTRQLADLIDAGIPILEALAALRENVSSHKFAETLSHVESQIRKGKGFSEALAERPEVFDDVYVGIVKAGETSGRLNSILNGLADYQERDQSLRSQIKGALSYPLITLAFSFLLCYALVAYLLPGFAPIWQQSGLNLSDYPVTLALMKLSGLTHNVFDEILVAVALAGLYVLYRKLVASGEGKLKRDSFLLDIPVIGSFVRMGILARVANTMGTLSESGINMVSALQISADTAGNEKIRQAMLEVSRKVQEGSSLSQAFRDGGEFPKMMVQMVGIGEKSGNIDEMLPRLARYYDRQLQDAMKTMTALLEPATMILIGGVVFTFVIGVFLPIMGIVKALQNQV